MSLNGAEEQVLTKYPDALRRELMPPRRPRLRLPSIGLGYYRKYSFMTYALMFFAFAFIGWCWEVAMHLYEDHVFVNRGTMLGPWLPIYGVGGTIGVFIMTVFTKRLLKYPAVVFVIVTAMCGTLEYFSSWLLEQIYHIRWWDYTGYFLNINGRVCAEGLLLFGFGGCAAIYFVAPAFDNMLSKIDMKTKIVLLAALAMLFAADLVYSKANPNIGKGITDYDSAYMKPPASAHSLIINPCAEEQESLAEYVLIQDMII